MDFSVVIPTYNVERYIAECITSAVAQRFDGEHEVLVIDDGSTDDTAQRIRELADRHDNVRAFHQPNDGAPGKARNRGIDAARGEFLVFLDSDDRLAPDALAFFRQAFDRHGVDVVVGARELIDEHSNVTGARGLPPACRGRHELAGELQLRLRPLYVNASAKAFRRAVVERAALRFPEGHPGQDTAFSIAYFAHARSFYADERHVYDVRIRGDRDNPSLTQQFNPRIVERRLISARQCVQALHAGGLHAYAADTHAYFLLGMLSRVMQEYRNIRRPDLASIHDALIAYRDDGRAQAPPQLMTAEVRRLWRLAALMLHRRWSFRLALSCIRLLRLR